MNIVVDANVLVRSIVEDDRRQSKAAQNVLEDAQTIAIANTALCELVWVLSRIYRYSRNEIAEAIRRATNIDNVRLDLEATAAGLALLEAGGDFADGVIAFEGRRLGADEFVSFDRKAVKLIQSQGQSARLLT